MSEPTANEKSREGTSAKNNSREIFLDVAKVYCGVLALIILAAVLAQFVSLIAQLLYAIVALLFFLVPEKLLERRGEDPAAYGIHLGNVRRGVLFGLGATLVTLPFFLPGYWAWETYGLKRDLQPDAGRYLQWDSALDGEPKTWGDAPGVWVWSDRDILRVGVRGGEQPNRVTLHADEPFEVISRGAVVATSMGDGSEHEVTLPTAQSRGVVTIRGPTEVTVRVVPSDGATAWPLYEGPNAREVATGELHEQRGVWWLVLWLATQLLLVALPEEVFYRGFLQTRLQQGFLARGVTGSFLGITPAIFVTSVLFGLGHLLVPVGGVLLVARLSVFFPSLLFGWLRDRTDSVLASTIYHACSNAMVLFAAVHFV